LPIQSGASAKSFFFFSFLPSHSWRSGHRALRQLFPSSFLFMGFSLLILTIGGAPILDFFFFSFPLLARGLRRTFFFLHIHRKVDLSSSPPLLFHHPPIVRSRESAHSSFFFFPERRRFPIVPPEGRIPLPFYDSVVAMTPTSRSILFFSSHTLELRVEAKRSVLFSFLFPDQRDVREKGYGPPFFLFCIFLYLQ